MSKPKSIPLFNADDPKQYPKRAEAIIPGVLHRPKLTTLWGPPGAGKSHVGLDLGCVVAQTLTVIYIAAEAVDEFLPRIDAWKDYYHKKLGNLWVWHEPVMVLDNASCQHFLNSIMSMKPAVIFIDPLAECFVGGDENSTKDMTSAIRNINIIRTSLQASICLLHHSGWNNSHERGSSVLRAATRLNLSVQMQNETIVLKAQKRNAGRLGTERYFKILEVGSEEATVLVPAPREMHPITGELPGKQQDALKALAMPVFRAGVRPPELAEFTNMGSSTFYKVMSALIERELAAKNAKTGLLSLTETGETVVSDIEWKASGKDDEILEACPNWIPLSSTSSPLVFPTNSTDIPLVNSTGPTDSTFLSTFLSLESGEVEEVEDSESGIEKLEVM